MAERKGHIEAVRDAIRAAKVVCYLATVPNHRTHHVLLTLGLISGLLSCAPACNRPSPVGPAQVQNPSTGLTTNAARTTSSPTNDKSNHIRVDMPLAGQHVHSPLEITGQARGGWYFEGSFPVLLLDAKGQVLAQHYAQAKGEWMTESFVPFSAKLTFNKPTTATGTLVLKKANASGLPEHDDELRIALSFE